MTTNQNKIQLNDEDRSLLAKAERESGKNWRVLLRQALANVQPPQPPENSASSRKAVIDEMLEEFQSMPLEGPDDGFSNRDHDKLLYGEK